MASKEKDIYGPCDRAIQRMNRENLRDFSRMKMAKWDQVNVIRTVKETYSRAQKRAQNEYVQVAYEAYMIMAAMCDMDPKEAKKKARAVITAVWVEQFLDEPDPVTLYAFNAETERKAQRLAETIAGVLEVRNGSGKVPARFTTVDAEIDKALRDWTRQTGQYAIEVTDAAAVQAMQDAGVDGAIWMTERDGRVCSDCHQLDGVWFPLDEVPVKPHYGCRCRLIPAAEPEG